MDNEVCGYIQSEMDIISWTFLIGIEKYVYDCGWTLARLFLWNCILVIWVRHQENIGFHIFTCDISFFFKQPLAVYICLGIKVFKFQGKNHIVRSI